MLKIRISSLETTYFNVFSSATGHAHRVWNPNKDDDDQSFTYVSNSNPAEESSLLVVGIVELEELMIQFVQHCKERRKGKAFRITFIFIKSIYSEN